MKNNIRILIIMRRICAAFLVILLFLLLAAHFVNKEMAGQLIWVGEDTQILSKNISAVSGEKGTEVLPETPSVSGASAVLIEAASGRVLFEHNKDERHHPASTTKIMTALLAVEHIEDQEEPDTEESEADTELKSIFTVSDNAAYQEGSSIFLKPGEKISLEDLLYGMMLRSGNDAAVAVAEGIGGSTEDFVTMMNEKVSALGLENTSFVNPNGLCEENHYSTAYDLAMIGREGMKHELFRRIVGTKVWNGSRTGADNYNYFYNKNKTIFQYDGGNGIKIGYTIDAGRCLVASAERNGMTLIAAVLNDHDWFNDAYEMFDYGFACYNNVLVAKGQYVLTRVSVDSGDKNSVAVGAYEDVLCPSIKGQKTDITLKYKLEKNVSAPVRRWQEAGSVEIYSAGDFVCSKKLYYLEDIDLRKGTKTALSE